MLSPRQAKLEATPLALLALHANGAAQSSGDALDHGQAQPDSRMTELSLLGAIKRLENVGNVRGRDAEAMVLNRQYYNPRLAL